MLFWNSLAFSMIQRMLTMLVPLPFLNPAWTSVNSNQCLRPFQWYTVYVCVHTQTHFYINGLYDRTLWCWTENLQFRRFCGEGEQIRGISLRRWVVWGVHQGERSFSWERLRKKSQHGTRSIQGICSMSSTWGFSLRNQMVTLAGRVKIGRKMKNSIESTEYCCYWTVCHRWPGIPELLK